MISHHSKKLHQSNGHVWVSGYSLKGQQEEWHTKGMEKTDKGI